jgi:hypothetical protein
MVRSAVVVSATLLSLVASTAPSVSAQDVNAMAKWTAATVVHYRIVGEFKGKWTILKGKKLSRDAQVNDRVEIDLDWDQMAFKLVGQPVIKNAPTTLGAIDAPRFVNMKGTCPPVRIDRQPEYVTVVGVTGLSSVLQLEQTRQMAGGALPDNGETATATCGEEWDPAAPATTTLKEGLTLPPAMAIVMPAMAGMTATPDGKSLVLKNKDWTWTYTPTIVK